MRGDVAAVRLRDVSRDDVVRRPVEVENGDGAGDGADVKAEKRRRRRRCDARKVSREMRPDLMNNNHYLYR